MLALFCLRLACGLAGALLLLSPEQVQARFFRVQFLTILGLTTAALLSAPEEWLLLGGVIVLAFLGSLAWSLQGAPGGRFLAVLTMLGLASVLAVLEWKSPARSDALWRWIADLTSAGLLGAALSAMLMGHSYLIAPTMSLTPLVRLLQALFVATLLRMAVAGVGLWSWTANHSWDTLDADALLWLPVRWGLGFLAPLVLGAMAWQTARIRSTQSATGILYVVVIFSFLGELTSQLLGGSTGLVL